MALISDTVTTLEARERDGALVSMRREFLVTGLTDTDHQALMSALTEAGLPAAGAALTGDYDLFVRERIPRIVPGDPTKARVEVVYEHFMNDGQNLSTPVTGVSYMHSRNSLQQITTELDADGDQITVEHTWPDTDIDHPGETHTQGGSITVSVPQPIITLGGLYTTDYPWLTFTLIVIGSVNLTEFAGCAAGTLLCTRADWEDWARGTRRVRVRGEWQYKKDGWNPGVIFKDPRTGLPPPALVADTGYKTVTWYPEADFNAFFDVQP